MKHLIYDRRKSLRFLAKFMLGFFLLVGSGIATAALEGHVNWGAGPKMWSFDHQVSGNLDGLTLSNVYFNGHKLLDRITLPTVRVFYVNNVCGPYADRLGGTLSPIPWMGNATLGKREFTTPAPDSTRWYEIGIRDQIGSYDMYQVYYLSEFGTLDAHIYSKGLQCQVNHIHYPNWRIDADLDGAGSDVIERNTGAGFVTLANEFNLNAASAANHAWRIRDTVTGTKVDVLPGFPDFYIPDGGPGTVPVTAYANNTVFGRLYKATDSLAWTFGPNTQVPFNEGENINVKDVVLWYEAYLPHTAAEGSALWHSTGVRLVSNLGTPPPPPVGTTWPFENLAAPTRSVAIPDIGNGTPYPSTINVSDVTGTVNKVKVELNSLSHTFPRDIDVVLVGPGGQAVKLMSDAGGGQDVNGVNLTFDPTATTPLPVASTSQIVSGTFVPTDGTAGSADAFPLPAPANASTAGTSLNVFNGINPNGVWSLYVVDDAAVDIGSLAGGWKLTLTTQ